jgi:hypothetical protein
VALTAAELRAEWRQLRGESSEVNMTKPQLAAVFAQFENDKVQISNWVTRSVRAVDPSISEDEARLLFKAWVNGY